MKLATMRTDGGTCATLVDGAELVELPFSDVGALLAEASWRSVGPTPDAQRFSLAGADLAPAIPTPGKIICVGLNYKTHIAEMGRDLPAFPTLFAKYPEALLGPADRLVLPPESHAVDWEAELAVVIGTRARRASLDTARAAIGGYSIINDVSMRDWQFRTPEWLQGKTFEASSPFGPYVVTEDELSPGARICCSVDDEVVQSSSIADLVFSPAQLVSYISAILTLNPGDVIATGTTGGVGHARNPPRYLRAGQVMRTHIEGIGTCVTPVDRTA